MTWQEAILVGVSAGVSVSLFNFFIGEPIKEFRRLNAQLIVNLEEFKLIEYEADILERNEKAIESRLAIAKKINYNSRLGLKITEQIPFKRLFISEKEIKLFEESSKLIGSIIFNFEKGIKEVSKIEDILENYYEKGNKND